MFVVNVTVTPSELAEKWHEQHVQFLNAQYENGTFLIFGRSKTYENQAVIIARAESQAALEQAFAQDPYIQHGCMTIKIEEFNAAKIAANISDYAV
ncbi:uncharacterized protein YciI [Cricetibacter osteomyelitidis]|uniref:Uncharacterized protein YciI n=1 Tax=Cricetibacter osteomyelitidis TaxID=1521931 RepID=A0A4R2T738_9PAST|nr:YciI family protein [Cricetibacter osteomyelitidis]TCP97316.1 uncharacterized protein YciI [Cricetibacter osteomyelitidis]